MPGPIKEWLQKEMPTTHKMWWMRCVMMNAEPIKLQSSGATEVYFRFGLRDIDAPPDDKQGYMVDIFSGSDITDFRPNDRVSLFGHELADATHLSFPLYFFHHELGAYGPCFLPKYLDQQIDPVVNLVADVPGSKRAKKINSVGRALRLIGWDPKHVDDAAAMCVSGGFDMRPLYKAISSAINQHVVGQPDAIFLCKNPRPKNAQSGRLVD